MCCDVGVNAFACFCIDNSGQPFGRKPYCDGSQGDACEKNDSSRYPGKCDCRTGENRPVTETPFVFFRMCVFAFRHSNSGFVNIINKSAVT
ncbi:hypothetical protein IMSAG025_00288 [Muribaculaceae bacterium]|nr:hypothetical protein IMSAG025_00288 [Muribaculaceae bacterium]